MILYFLKKAWIGFTATTGDSSGEYHDVLDWHYEFLGIATPQNYEIYGVNETLVAGDNSTFFIQVKNEKQN